MNYLYYIAGGIFLLAIIIFFYLAKKKKYRDKTAAENYEKVRNKLTIREEEKEQEPEEDIGGMGLSSILVPTIFLFFVFGVILIVGTEVMSQMSLALNESSLAYNQTNTLSIAMTSSITNFIPIIGVIILLTVVILLISSVTRATGLV